MVIIYLPDIPEFSSLVKAARRLKSCRVCEPVDGYRRVEADRVIDFSRKDLGLGPALWNSALSGGFVGRIVEYDRDYMRIESEDSP